MNFLLETCVLSEFTRRSPTDKVVRWIDSHDEESLFLSVITIGEIQHGIACLPDSQRKNDLNQWLNIDLSGRFGKRILTLDAAIMIRWGTLSAKLEEMGKPMSVMDALLVATALEYDLVLVTQNITDFQNSGVRITNPWE